MKQDVGTMQMVRRIIGALIVIALAIYGKWLIKPAINLRSEGFYAYIILIGIISVIIFSICEIETSYILTKISGIILLLALIVLIIGSFFSNKLVNAKRYANLINVGEGNFSEEIMEVSDMEQFPILDVETAEKLGNRAIGNLERTSQYEVNDEYNLISYQGKQYRLSPLEYQGYFQARNSYNYEIPGYVLVDSITQEAKLVKLEESINYAPTAKGDRNLKRYLRNKYPSYIFDKFQFDIDEDGKPYYVVPVKEATIGLFGGKLVKSFIIVNANNGECEEYSPKKLPDWVDHAYSLDYLMELAENYYTYQNGFWNTFFKKEGVKNISYEWREIGKDGDEDEDEEEDKKETYFPGYNSLKTNEGIQFFTCVTSAGNDESAIGFILANSKTGEIKFYQGEGAEEYTAQRQAESLAQNYGYTSTYPLIVNVDGVQTYILALKDKAKTNMAYVMINVGNYTNAVKGENLQETLEQYRKAIGKGSLNPSNTAAEEEKEETVTLETTGNIVEIYQVIQEGNTCYFFFLENDENLYISSILINSRQVRLKVGSNVTIKYRETSEEKVELVSEIIINTK